jgi:hypothetical protein
VLAVALVLSLLAALPYLAVGGLDAFINMDDDVYVYENPRVLKGLTIEGVRWAFTAFHISNWHPLTWLSHMTDVTIFGNDARGHHLVNILLHSLNTSLLFLSLFRMTAALWRSALVAALFALHPLHIESVAWIAERKDVLSGLFFMLVLLAYEWYVRRGGRRRYLLVALFLALGLMAKPMLVTVPFLLLLLDLWPLGRTAWAAPAGGGEGSPVSPGRLLWEKVPLLALALVSSGITFLAQRAGGAIKTLEFIGTDLRLANVAVSYVAYIGKTLWPLSLSMYYPFPPEMPPGWKVGGAVLVTAAVTAAAVFLRRRPYFLVGWLWYLGMLVPVIGLVQVGDQAMADRYAYLPLTGLFVMAVWGSAELLRGRRRRWSVGAAAGVLLILTPLAARQAGYWKDSITLFSHALSVAPGSHIIHNNLANSLVRAGRTNEAITHYREALREKRSPTSARPFACGPISPKLTIASASPCRSWGEARRRSHITARPFACGPTRPRPTTTSELS